MTSSSSKNDLGQFFTTNVDQILAGFEPLIVGKQVSDPFAGRGNILRWAEKNGARSIRGCDIDPAFIDQEKVFQNDSLLMVPRAEFSLTNPPYLAKNKMTEMQKKTYMLDDYEDFYLLAIKRIIISEPKEGIIIVPINFLSAENSDALRAEFLSRHQITRARYFAFPAFEDTSYNVIAFHYVRREGIIEKQKLTIEICSEFGRPCIKLKVLLEREFQYRIAGRELEEVVRVKTDGIVRLTQEIMEKSCGENRIEAFFNDKKTEREYWVDDELFRRIKGNIFLLHCIDTNPLEAGWIRAEDVRSLGKDCLVGKVSSRNIAYILLPDDVSIERQERAIGLFNERLNGWRKEFIHCS